MQEYEDLGLMNQNNEDVSSTEELYYVQSHSPIRNEQHK